MKIFTVRELDREPGVVLDVCDRDGAVRIRRRDGRSYTIQPDARPERIAEIPDFKARIAAIFSKEFTSAQTQRADRLLAGE